MPAENFIPKIDAARALALYDDGATDGEIAAVFGVSKNGICQWRRRHGLLRVSHNDNRLTDAQVRRAKNLLRDGATKAQVAAHIGVSTCAIKAIRRKMNNNEIRCTGINGMGIRNAIVADASLPRRIEQAIGMHVPKDIRMDAANDMYLELLDGKIKVEHIESAAARFRSRAFSMAGHNYSTRSIDEENEEGFSLADILVDPNWEQPFEQVLDLVFDNDD